LLVGVRRDQARIDSEAFATHQPFHHGTLNHRLEQMAKGVAVPKTAVPRFGEGGVVGDAVFQAKPTGPPIGKIESDFQNNNQRSACCGSMDGRPRLLKGSQMGAQFTQINKPINLAQQIIARDPILQAKLVKQLRLIVLLWSHHTDRAQ
jgi:hypothetical protein